MINKKDYLDYYRFFVTKDNLYYSRKTVAWDVPNEGTKDLKPVGWGYRTFKKREKAITIDDYKSNMFKGVDKSKVVLLSEMDDDYLLNSYRYFRKRARLWRAAYVLKVIKKERESGWLKEVASRKDTLVDILKLEVNKRKLKMRTDYSINLKEDLPKGFSKTETIKK